MTAEDPKDDCFAAVDLSAETATKRYNTVVSRWSESVRKFRSQVDRKRPKRHNSEHRIIRKYGRFSQLLE
jgi:hypothetical protein